MKRRPFLIKTGITGLLLSLSGCAENDKGQSESIIVKISTDNKEVETPGTATIEAEASGNDLNEILIEYRGENEENWDKIAKNNNCSTDSCTIKRNRSVNEPRIEYFRSVVTDQSGSTEMSDTIEVNFI